MSEQQGESRRRKRSERYGIVVGQSIPEGKRLRARELRRELTPKERVLWEHVRDHRMQGLGFRRQQIIDRFIVDFYCHAVGLVVEVDGSSHREQAEYDRERDTVPATRGLRILRVTNEEVRDALPDVLERIAAACALPRASRQQSG
jgi:very-short-patch-repair endonuclease